MEMQQSFGKISGYKLSPNKSEILTINEAAIHCLPFQIAKNGFDYIGIHIFQTNQKICIEITSPLCCRKLLLILNIGPY